MAEVWHWKSPHLLSGRLVDEEAGHGRHWRQQGDEARAVGTRGGPGALHTLHDDGADVGHDLVRRLLQTGDLGGRHGHEVLDGVDDDRLQRVDLAHVRQHQLRYLPEVVQASVHRAQLVVVVADVPHERGDLAASLGQRRLREIAGVHAKRDRVRPQLLNDGQEALAKLPGHHYVEVPGDLL